MEFPRSVCLIILSMALPMMVATSQRCAPEETSAACGVDLARDNVLLQSHIHTAMGKFTLDQGEEKEEDVAPSREIDEEQSSTPEGVSGERLPLCHPDIIVQTCSLLKRDAEGSPLIVGKELLRDLLSASVGDMASAWSALDLPDRPDVGCQELCESVVKYVVRVDAVLPPTSDVACVTIGSNTTCDVGVSPYELAQKLSLVQDAAFPDEGPQIVSDEAKVKAEPGLVQISFSPGRPTASLSQSATAYDSGASGTRSNDEDGVPPCPYTTWQVVERLANFFRMHPSDGQDHTSSGIALLQGSATLGDAQVRRTIATREQQAKAWLGTVASAMENRQTVDLRRKWFGGGGGQSEEAVRQKVFRTMNFIQRELQQGFHYIYPADNAPRTACGGGALAYVWRGDGGSRVYKETQGPVCNSANDAWSKECAVDRNGKFFVYLCTRYSRADKEFGESMQIATLVHEAAHHAGPSDISYYPDQMQSNNQDQQLYNAGNYQYFAQEVAQKTWPSSPRRRRSSSQSCKDDYGSCQYYKDNNYCGTPNVANQCRKTCGSCTSAQPQTCRDTYGSCQYYVDNGYCGTDGLRGQCLKSCRLC